MRDRDNPSLWINDAWVPDSPATFAVVIGESAYRHLNESANSFGLGSVFSSALTAHYVFRRLGEHYRGPDVAPGEPLAMVWYLTPASAAEVDVEPFLGETPVVPTFADCSTTIGE